MKDTILEQGADKLLFMEPVFTHNIWGGSRLRDEFGYSVEGNDIGECWGISAHPSGECVIRNGKYKGQKLSDLWLQRPELFGNLKFDRFPLLVKIIDAREDLSIQVHPDDVYAKEHENGSLGKTECWYILDCSENATLVIGHNAHSRQELRDMVFQGRWKELIREVPVKKGDFIQIDPGTVHAIKGGIMILETQQSSDITYRVYDYDRLSDGKPRQLHIEQSLDVITVPAQNEKDCVKPAANLPENRVQSLYSCKYYNISKAVVNGEMSFQRTAPFVLATAIEGDGTVNRQAVKKGDHFIIPADVQMIELSGRIELILSSPV